MPDFSTLYHCNHSNEYPDAWQVSRGVLTSVVTVAIVGFNVLGMCVVHSDHYRRHMRDQARMLLTSLACTDLAMGVLVTPFCIYPSVYECWPFSEWFCQIEAVLIGTLFHQSTLALMCIAVERYVCILHPLRYDAIMTHRRCVVMVAGTWAVTFVCYAAIVLAARLFYFDSVGATCEPFYGNPTLTFSVIGLFYVPPLVVLVFCYGRIYLVTRQQVRRIAAQAEYINGLSHPSDSAASETEMGNDGQPRRHCRAVKSSKTPAAIALGFFIAVTPWTLSQLIPLGGTPVNATLDFLLTWLALSNSFWNVVIYGIISKSYRNAASKLLVDLVHKNRGSSVRPAIASVPANSGRHDAPPVLALEQGSVEPMELQSC